MNIQQAVSRFGAAVKAKSRSAAAVGEPEDQLRAPFEQLFADVAALLRACYELPAAAKKGTALGSMSMAKIRK